MEQIKSKTVRTYKELDVFQRAMNLTMKIFEITKRFPKEEQYSLTDQIRRSSRSVCTNIGEAWRKRRYEAAFISKLSDAETEACETQIWVEIARRCGYLTDEESRTFDEISNHIMSQTVLMIEQSKKWLIRK